MNLIKKMLVALIISITTLVMIPVTMPINELKYSVEAASIKASQKVYITPTGKKYHLKSTCGGKNSKAITLSKAKAKKLTPCKKCVKATVTSVKISKTKYTMNKGEKYTLKIKGTSKKVSWTSSNKKVATVNSKGKITAKKKGTATITAKVGSKKYKCKITVEAPSISKTKVSINEGKTYTLKMKGTSRKVSWTSSNKKVATINSKGKVTAKKAGIVTITGKVGNTKYKCKVTVKKKTTQVTIGQKNALKSAKSYLDFMSFSEKELRRQLEYEKYSKSEIDYAIKNCGANWKKEALESAKSYLDFSAFSKKGLIEQLEYEGFREDEINYAIKYCKADWYKEAAECAKSYLNFSSFSRSELYDQLEYEGFTKAQIEYGLKAVGY